MSDFWQKYGTSTIAGYCGKGYIFYYKIKCDPGDSHSCYQVWYYINIIINIDRLQHEKNNIICTHFNQRDESNKGNYNSWPMSWSLYLTVFWQEFTPDWQSEVAVFKSSLTAEAWQRPRCLVRYALHILKNDYAGDHRMSSAPQKDFRIQFYL